LQLTSDLVIANAAHSPLFDSLAAELGRYAAADAGRVQYAAVPGKFRLTAISGLIMVDRNAAAIADQLLALPSADRARLAQLLLASLEERDPGAAAAWDDEITRRAADLETGRVAGIPADEVFAEVERRLRR
jgi:putative addiction module component (TIGR02574 family)